MPQTPTNSDQIILGLPWYTALNQNITVPVFIYKSIPSGTVCNYTEINEQEMELSRAIIPPPEESIPYQQIFLKKIAVYCREGYSSPDFPDNPVLKI